MKKLALIFLLSFFLVKWGIATGYRPYNLPGIPADTLAKGINIIPQPQNIQANGSRFMFNKQTVLLLPVGLSIKEVKAYQKRVKMFAGMLLPVKHHALTNYISLKIDSTTVAFNEGYIMQIDYHHISIAGHDAAGLFYGLQSLVQLADISGGRGIPGCTITDHPRFAYRGMHLDVSRHMFPVAAIKKWINVLSLYKLNTFHWHLTDDQGWRIEIKKYPKLQSISANRDETLIGHKKEMPHLFNGKPYGGYYTQEEIKQVIGYATERHINIIPEIEMPGHAMAALAAYPELGCTGGPYKTATFWGVFNDVYCAGNEDTFTFLQNVLDEVITLFPSKYIHIGGDECPKLRWHECPRCQKRIVDNHLKDEKELQTYFISRMEKYVNSKGRQIIGWDEILEGGLSPGATVMSWTGESGGIAAAKQHHNAIMTPEKYVYMDYYQSLYPGEQLAAGGYLPLSKVYGYEPVPAGLNIDEAKHISGVQANVWSEYLDNENKAEYAMFPRMLALSEIAWSAKENRNYPDFLKRLRVQMPLVTKLGLNAANVFDEITWQEGKAADGKTTASLASTLPGALIRFTTDGTEPGSNSAVYSKSLVINYDQTIKAAVFSNGQQTGRAFQKHFLYNKATGKPVTLVNQPIANYNPGDPSALVNGIEAGNLYNDGQWFGFSGTNLEAVVDLGSMQPINTIGINILKYHWQRMWEPVELTFWVSADNVNYGQIYSQKEFPVNGINRIRLNVTDTRAMYIKIIAVNKGTIPTGEYGAGGKALLLTDEIIVN